MAKKSPEVIWHEVRKSTLHGHGVFAVRDIPEGTCVFEYMGERISPEEADARHPTNPDDPFHTFFFATSGGLVIDGGVNGNDARWVNHACAPNCEARENTKGTRVFIVALRDIQRGEELFYDYGLVLEGRRTKKRQLEYQCRCGYEACRGTMLSMKRRKA